MTKIALTAPGTKKIEMNYPPVSFIIPAHNEANYLAATLVHIQRATQALGILSQIIVVDDDSTDETASVACGLGAEVVFASLRNIGAVRNAGAARACHDHLIFVDADTLLPQETLRQTLEALAAGCVGGGAIVDVDKTRHIPFQKYLMFLLVSGVWQTLGRWAAGCYLFCTKQAFIDIGGFPEDYFAAEEYFVSRGLKSRGKFCLVRGKVITSARKLHDYSTWQLIRFLVRPMFSRKGFLKSRDGLEVLYDHNR